MARHRQLRASSRQAEPSREGPTQQLARYRLLALLSLGLVLGVAQCRAEETRYRLKAVSFTDLPGFSSDKLEDALRAFARSCSGPAHSLQIMPSLGQRDLKQACAAAARDENRKNPRGFFERYFQPFQITVDSAPDAFFTGYYQPEISGSLTQSAKFPTPVYGLPPDLVVFVERESHWFIGRTHRRPARF